MWSITLFNVTQPVMHATLTGLHQDLCRKAAEIAVHLCCFARRCSTIARLLHRQGVD